MSQVKWSRLYKQLSIDIVCAFGTWFVVAASACYFMSLDARYGSAQVLVAASAYLLFVVQWLTLVSEGVKRWHQLPKIALLIGQYLCILLVYFSVPYTYSAILVTLWCTLLPPLIGVRWAMLSAPLWSAPLWLVYQYYWGQDYMAVSALLFLMFNYFALIMVRTANNEREAKEHANQLNRELLATQKLLSQATKQAERVRIARNIHDLLGHHLTALTINLQIAARITEGEAHQRVETCHGLARLLLSDVREAVSEIREKSTLDLKEALHALFDNLPNVTVKLDYPEHLNIDAVETADVLLKCVQESLTNSIKHGSADRVTVSLTEIDNVLTLKIADNGTLPSRLQQARFKVGNGLRGMQERIATLGGNVYFAPSQTGFKTTVTIPVESA
jgi:two-component system, NarL family, sensor histidine kinase DesK